MKDRIPGADCRLGAPKRLPRQSNARLKSGLVELDADSAVRVRSRNQVITPWRRSTLAIEIKIRLAVLGLGDGCHQSPGQSQVQG